MRPEERRAIVEAFWHIGATAHNDQRSIADIAGALQCELKKYDTPEDTAGLQRDTKKLRRGISNAHTAIDAGFDATVDYVTTGELPDTEVAP